MLNSPRYCYAEAISGRHRAIFCASFENFLSSVCPAFAHLRVLLFFARYRIKNYACGSVLFLISFKRFMKLLARLFFSLLPVLYAAPAFSDSVWSYGVSEAGGWKDYNKSWNGDSNMCWAAASSNIIDWWQENSAYARYAASGTPSGREVWDTFSSSFTNKGGHDYFAYNWYFFGSYAPYENNYDDSWSMPVDTSNIGGGYYTGAGLNETALIVAAYDSLGDNCADYYSGFSSYIVNSLKSGCALTLGISNLGGDEYEANSMAHAMTMWGCDYTTDADGNVAIDTLYITDSDDYDYGLKAVSCYGLAAGDGEVEQFCFSSSYYNTATQEAYGDFYIEEIFGLNLIAASVPEPSCAILILSGLPFVFRRKRRC